MAKNFDNRSSYNKTVDSDVTYTGDTKDGFVQGETLASVIPKLIEAYAKISELQAQVADLTTRYESIKADGMLAESSLFDLVDKSDAVSSSLDGKKVNLEVRESSLSGKADIVFDFSEAISTLSDKYVPVSTDTSVRTYNAANKLIGSSSSKTGAITVDKLAGPIIVTSKINLKSTEGDIILSKSFYVPVLTPDTMSGVFGVSGISTFESKSTTQKNVNEILASNVSRLNKAYDALEKKLSSIEKQA